MTDMKMFKDRDSFLNLTSDSAIREAAYPKDEWRENGGGSSSSSYTVVNQDDPPVIEIKGGLWIPGASFKTVEQDPKKRAENINNYWAQVKLHPYYCLLKKNRNFVEATNKFNKKKSKAKTGKLLSEFSDIRFVRLVAQHIGYYLLMAEFGYKPVYADAKLLNQANGYVIKLQKSFKSGVLLNNWFEQRSLADLLGKLHHEILNAPRKEKVSETSEKRKCLEGFAREYMLLGFGAVSASVLYDLAGVLGWDPEHTTIDRVILDAKERLSETQAKISLENTAQKS